MRKRLLAPGPLLLFLLALGLGCQRAGRYDPGPARGGKSAGPSKRPDEKESLPEHLGWMDTGREPIARGDVRIEFVAQRTRPQEWKKLKRFWNDPPPARAAAVLGLPGLTGAALAAAPPAPVVVQVKVPLGLEDPTPFIPAANPPTRGKWELGRRLFFDEKWLTPGGKVSCATCHVPGLGYTDGRREVRDSYNTPTLVNCVYNTHQFWDGRARYLEEVVQRTLEDERGPARGERFRHVWGGVVTRLRADRAYADHFDKVFGTLPSQDGVGKALATYLRTLLAANSLHDRAVRAGGGKGAPEEGHYLAVLDDSALNELGRARGVKELVAADLLRGYKLFTGRAGCAGCHPPGNGVYADGQFHNVGAGLDELNGETFPGRFRHAPLGEKHRFLIGAYKTPTLRNLLRTGPYFHNGQTNDLAAAVRLHVEAPEKPGELLRNLYLDPRLSDANGAHRDFGLGEDDVRALVLFLRALNGEDVDPSVKARPAP